MFLKSNRLKNLKLPSPEPCAFSFQPGLNFASDTPHEYLYHLTGSHDMSALKANINCSAQCAAAGTECGGNDDPPIPENFDARVKYPQCESIGKVHDQGACKSDYVSA